MYTKERIYGPLTFKQFLCAAAGFGLYYYLDSFVPEQYQMVAIGAIVVVTIMAILRFKPEKIGNVDEYFKVKKAELDPKAYQRMLQMKYAEVLSQIHMRKAKGLADDLELLKGAELFEKLINEGENK